MQRFLLGLTVFTLTLTPTVRAHDGTKREQTVAFIAALRNPDGGYAPKPGQPSSLGTTSSALRVLKTLQRPIGDPAPSAAFVKSCHDAASGGFAPTPGGKPDVHTTAVGLMAVAALGMPASDYAPGAIAFFSRNVKAFEDIRIAVAGLEAIGKTSPDFPAWTARVMAGRNADGTFGKGASQARDTGGAAVALLRMGVTLDKKDAVVAAIKAGQRPDGGWSKDEGGSNLEATYRVMRACFMLKERPDLEKLREFIAHCQQADGSFATAPGGTGDLGGTYFATTILAWVEALGGEPSIAAADGFTPLFNGRDLTGWEGETSLWSVRDGMLVGTSPGLKHNEFLATTRGYGDFVLKATFRLVGGEGNSGIQFRSVRVPDREMSGYQADVGQQYWGCLYDESRRNRVLAQASPEAIKAIDKAGWNHYEVRAVGDQVTLTLNGVTSVHYRETDPAIARDGLIAVQIHQGGPMEVQFKDLLIRPLGTR